MLIYHFTICVDPSQTSADATGDTKATAVMDIATARKDCVAFISPARADVVGVANAITQTQNVVGFADGLPSTSYAVIDSGYKYMYDRYNDVYRFVPLERRYSRTYVLVQIILQTHGFHRAGLIVDKLEVLLN